MNAPAQAAAALPPGAVGGPVDAQLPSAPFCGIALVGEAPGRDEVVRGHPFAGAAGQRLDAALAEAGIDRARCLVANPFRWRPENNRIAEFFANDSRAKAEGLRVNAKLPLYAAGRCVEPHDEDVRILWRLLRQTRPRVIVALGNTACWALLWRTGITRLAGQRFETRACAATVVPTYHPSYLLRRAEPVDDAAFLQHLRLAKAINDGI